MPHAAAPEYLQLFAAQGPIRVEVHFTPAGPRIARRYLDAAHAQGLLDPSSGMPWTHMRFDDHCYRVDRYVWAPGQQQLSLFVSLESTNPSHSTDA